MVTFCIVIETWGGGLSDMSSENASRRAIHWEKTKRATWVVLAIWFLFALVFPWFARELNSLSFLGFELGYYLIVQGALIVFVLLIVGHNFVQDKIDDEFGSGDS